MVAGSHSMKWFVTVGLAAINCFVLGSCRGAGFAAQEAQQAIPDLLAVSPSVTGNGLVADAPFTLSATVTNAGDGASPATTLRYYRSTDATIATSDTEVGSDPIGELAASGSTSQSLELTAPSNPGTYYYGACVDAVTDESDTTNNCSGAVQVTVREPEPERHPDLLVKSPSVTGNGLVADAPFTLSATVTNAGDGASPATTLHYYLSTDATIATSDTEVGSDPITELAASGSSSQSLELTAPATPGAYYYGACVDAVTDESDTTNNCSGAVQVTVREPEPERHPDLLVKSPSVTGNGLVADAPFTLSATVTNAGDGASPATTLRYYRSTEATIATSDTEVGSDPIAELAASGSTSQSLELTAPSNPGTYYYGACVDALTDESDTTNNCSASVQVTIPEPKAERPTDLPEAKPDLIVTSASVSETGPAAGAQFTLYATVENDGGGDSEATTLRYYRSADLAIMTSDTLVGTDAVPGLVASGSSRESVSVTAPSTPGTYYYGACVEAVTDESDTMNNCSTSVAVTVPEPSTQGDLPSAPTSFQHECINPTCASIRFKWSPPAQGLPLLRYEFYFGGPGGLWNDIAVPTDQQDDVEFPMFLAPFLNGTFTAKARAVNEHGTGPEATLTLSVPPEEVQEQVPPTQVTNLMATSCPSCDRVRLYWSPPETGLPITRYEVWASNHPQWQATVTDVDGNPYWDFAFVDDEWDAGTYEYKVRATNRHGTGPEASVSLERTR